MLDLARVRAIVYDLDGTVYDDTHHFDLYARKIQSYLPADLQERYLQEYEAVVAGRHGALRVGTFYDVERDLVLEVKGGRVRRALHWDGAEVQSPAVQSAYPEAVVPDQVKLINVGDLWWVPPTIALHYGGNREHNRAAFLEIRELMATPAFTMNPIAGLADVVAALKGKVVQVLATNSPQPDSEAILAKIGLIDLLDRKFYSSQKPVGLPAILNQIVADYNLPMESILSVGDNLANEIAPARALGCQAVYLDPHNTADDDAADLVVRSMRAFLPTLRQLAGSR